ncbi:hypothetical protein OUZ56_003985 [Daphnia magna]|uniref:Secreted protein n=1 Tax=Daphnia magna TaxID=35525 RepID=A0ABQ9YNE4_9CRUS|nr:hypothetical protein OUZ56_003985 [Daphnia magna]
MKVVFFSFVLRHQGRASSIIPSFSGNNKQKRRRRSTHTHTHDRTYRNCYVGHGRERERLRQTREGTDKAAEKCCCSDGGVCIYLADGGGERRYFVDIQNENMQRRCYAIRRERN